MRPTPVISDKVYVWLVAGSVTLVGGGVHFGIPGGIFPVNENGSIPFCSKIKAAIDVQMIMMVFRADKTENKNIEKYVPLLNCPSKHQQGMNLFYAKTSIKEENK